MPRRRHARSSRQPSRPQYEVLRKAALSAASCWSILATASSPTRLKVNGTRSFAHWPMPAKSERGREHDQFILDKAVHERLVAMTADFNELWKDPDTPSRERKRLLAHTGGGQQAEQGLVHQRSYRVRWLQAGSRLH